MQTLDHSVFVAKHQFLQAGIFSSAHQRQPVRAFDDITVRQLHRFLNEADR